MLGGIATTGNQSEGHDYPTLGMLSMEILLNYQSSHRVYCYWKLKNKAMLLQNLHLTLTGVV